MDKGEFRKGMRIRRRAVPVAEREEASAQICRQLIARADVKAAMAARSAFAVYLALPDEIDLAPFVERLWAAECPVLLPAWRDGAYVLARYRRETALVAGPMGVREPQREEGGNGCVPEPAVWIVPGLAFTHAGARLGYGGGWYDRFLAAARPEAVSIGVAYAFQIVDSIPSEPHDIPLTAVVSVPLPQPPSGK